LKCGTLDFNLGTSLLVTDTIVGADPALLGVDPLATTFIAPPAERVRLRR
jgi:hypothetical protein